MSVLSLDEHIEKAEQDAKRAETEVEWGLHNWFRTREDALEYAQNCRQLAEWLKDYKRLLEFTQMIADVLAWRPSDQLWEGDKEQ